MHEHYQEDLAYIHHVGYEALAQAAAPVLLAELSHTEHTRGLIVDLGCGSGLLAAELTNAGWDVLGIDQSPAMLELARRSAPQARFQLGSLLAAEIPPCVAVAATGECFNYLFDPQHSMNALENLLLRIHAALSPGGVLLFDVAEPGRVPGPGPAVGFREGPGFAVLYSATEDRAERLLRRQITSFRQIGDMYRRSYEEHFLRLLPREEIRLILANVGFQSRTLESYGHFHFPPGYVAFLSDKGKQPRKHTEETRKG